MPKNKVITSSVGQKGKILETWQTQKKDMAENMPIIVLVDDKSASASEIVAAALQEHSRALIMGKRTFGKGTIQLVFPADPLGALKYTTNFYLTPKKRFIQAYGVQPDIYIKGKKDKDILRAMDNPDALIPKQQSVMQSKMTYNEGECFAFESGDPILSCAIQFFKTAY